jgi:hypothetical protein
LRGLRVGDSDGLAACQLLPLFLREFDLVASFPVILPGFLQDGQTPADVSVWQDIDVNSLLDGLGRSGKIETTQISSKVQFFVAVPQKSIKMGNGVTAIHNKPNCGA